MALPAASGPPKASGLATSGRRGVPRSAREISHELRSDLVLAKGNEKFLVQCKQWKASASEWTWFRVVLGNEGAGGAAQVVDAVRPVLPDIDLAVRVRDLVDDAHPGEVGGGEVGKVEFSDGGTPLCRYQVAHRQ